MPRLGGKKLYYLLKEPLLAHGIDIGRDKLFDILGAYNLLVRRRKRRKPLTTDSGHPFFKYPNLIRELEVVRPNQLWVSDITYIPIGAGFCYLSLITDAYSRKVVGWCLWENLKRDGTVQALKDAMSGADAKSLRGLIHHSDRGLQYCSGEYTDLLSGSGVTISMTERGDPYENAIAERVNGILKSEFGLGDRFSSYGADETLLVNCPIFRSTDSSGGFLSQTLIAAIALSFASVIIKWSADAGRFIGYALRAWLVAHHGNVVNACHHTCVYHIPTSVVVRLFKKKFKRKGPLTSVSAFFRSNETVLVALSIMKSEMGQGYRL